MSYTTRWEGNNIVVTFKDVITYEEMFEVNNLIWADPRFDLMNYQICDVRNVDRAEFDLLQAKEMATLDKTSCCWNENYRIAFIVPDNRFDALINFYKVILEEAKIKIATYNRMEEALIWCKCN